MVNSCPVFVCVVCLVLMVGCDRADSQPDAPPAEPAELVRTQVRQFHMGMMVYLTVWAESEPQGQQACRAAFERIRTLNMIMSDYEPESELSRLMRQAGQGPVQVSVELFEVLQRSQQMAEMSEGLFDVTAGPVIRLWRDARRTEQRPDPDALAQALARTGHDNMVLDPQARTVELTLPGMKLDLGGIAKGYIGDAAMAVLREHGITRAAYEAGGDMILGDPPPGETGWQIEPPDVPPQADDPAKPVAFAGDATLDQLRQPLHLSNVAVSISGDTVQYVTIDGKRYSHIINPRTGKASTHRQMCIIIAPDGFTSDPLATLGILMPPDQFHNLLREHYPQVRAWTFITDLEDQRPTPHIPPPPQ